MDYKIYEPKAKNQKEERYIIRRRLKALAGSVCFYLFRIFPVDRKLISVCTFEGKGGFGCNPKYLVQAIHDKDKSIKFVWLVNDMDKEFPDYIKKVPNTLISRAYWLTRSGGWIDNYRKPYGTVKRRGQYYVNVNHYTIGMKCTGLWRGDGFSKMAYLVSKNDSDMMDALVIDSKWCEMVSPLGLVYDGSYLKTGAPRCDVLYSDRSEKRAEFRLRHGIPQDARVVMYAPTFREGAVDGRRQVYSAKWTLDFERLLMNMQHIYRGEWYICTRVHPQLAESFDINGNDYLSERMIDDSHYDDMYELLAAVDAYITDYSSAAFEAATAGIPTFLYADDVTEYVRDRGNMMWDMDSEDRRHIANNREITPEIDTYLPFALARNNDELEQDISEFDMSAYLEEVDRFKRGIGMEEQDNASGRLADIVLDEMK